MPVNVVVPAPLCNKDIELKAPVDAGVPAKPALTVTEPELLKTKLGLVSTPDPVTEPPLTTTELTALLAVISKVPPEFTMICPVGVTVLFAPISSTPLLTVVVPV